MDDQSGESKEEAVTGEGIGEYRKWRNWYQNEVDQYASSPYNAKLAVSSLAVTETTASTHCAYPRWTARLSWPVWLVTNQGGMPAEDGHPSQY